MSESVDLQGLAIDRGGAGREGRARRRLLTRYLAPLLLITGFLSLAAWAARDVVFPPRSVDVVPVLSTTTDMQHEGTPLFKAAGWIEPRPTPVRVAALAPGVVEALHVVEDQCVKAGESIAELVKEDAQLTLEAALAELKLREAELEAAQAQLAAAQTRLKQPVHLQAAVGEAEALLAKLETELANLPFALRRATAELQAAQQDYDAKLAAAGVVASVQIDIAASKVGAAESLVEELRNRSQSLSRESDALTLRRDALSTQLSLLADEMEARDGAAARLKAAAARIEQAKVVVAQAQLQLNRMTIRAPMDGRIYRLVGHPGARIGGALAPMTGHDGSTIVTMYRPEMLQVRVDVRFEDVPQVGLGQQVQIDNPALSAPLTGEVLFISSEADIQKNTLQAKVAISDPPVLLKPEMLVDVTFLAPPAEAGTVESSQPLRLYVPRQLVRRDDGAWFVWLADLSEGVARKTIVKTGADSDNGLLEITDGLTVASRVISSDIDGLQDGDRIRVAGEDAMLGTRGAWRHRGGNTGGMKRLPAEGGIRHGLD